MSIPKTANTGSFNSSLLKNSAWGIVSSMLQIFFVLIFFIIIARKYNTEEFAQFLISTTVYQVIAAFSSLGLGQWFIREYEDQPNKLAFTGKFLKTQAWFGIMFYLVNIVIAYVLYPDSQIRLLCIILGTNILFDNLINALKTLNIAKNQQRNTALILVADGFMKLMAGCSLFLFSVSPPLLAGILIIARIFTLGAFIRIGSSGALSIAILKNVSVSSDDLKKLVLKNWRFAVIGSISIIYWRIGNIIISKMLTLADVANYEIAFRIFSVFMIFPVVASATVFPRMVKLFKEAGLPALKNFYRYAFIIYTAFAALSYAFICCFAEMIIVIAFGEGYFPAAECLKLMFLTSLPFPIVLLQANLLVAIGLEKMDMWFNILSLALHICACIIGLYYIRELSMINYAVFGSFMLFQIMQDSVLLRKKIISPARCIAFYACVPLIILSFNFLIPIVQPFIFFPVLTLVLVAGITFWYFRNAPDMNRLIITSPDN
jgi:O-antigen/teichoic acid export membrane protein